MSDPALGGSFSEADVFAGPSPVTAEPETLQHVPDEPRSIGGADGLIYCRRCGRLLSSERGPAVGAAKPCRHVTIGFRAA